MKPWRHGTNGATNEPRRRQRPAEELRLTALFSNAPPGTRIGPRFRFTQIASAAPIAEMPFFPPLPSSRVLDGRLPPHFSLLSDTKSGQTADKEAEFCLRFRIQKCPSADTKKDQRGHQQERESFPATSGGHRGSPGAAAATRTHHTQPCRCSRSFFRPTSRPRTREFSQSRYLPIPRRHPPAKVGHFSWTCVSLVPRVSAG